MALSAVLFASLALGTGAGEVTAEEALRRSMERCPSVNVDAIAEVAGPMGGKTIRLRMWRDVSGRRRTEVISPLNMQGQVSVDDGKTWTTYFPDDRRIHIRPSPMVEPDDLEFRMRLIRKNYRLEIDGKSTIAGRPAIRVVAKPRWPSGQDTRRFYLDAATYVSLKVDSVNESGPTPATYSVFRIDFPARMERSVFDPPSNDGARRDLAKPPLALKDAEDAERRLGFRPAVPRRLPMGFRPQGMTLWDWRDKTPIQIRLTDGLVRLNVYQFRVREGDRHRHDEDKMAARTVGDIRIEVRGDAPASVREKILGVYAAILAGGPKADDSGERRNPNAGTSVVCAQERRAGSGRGVGKTRAWIDPFESRRALISPLPPASASAPFAWRA